MDNARALNAMYAYHEPEEDDEEFETFLRMEEQKYNSQWKVTGGSNTSYDWPDWVNSCIDWIDYREMNFNRGNIAKAVDRWGNKPGATLEYDLEKIIFYAERELEKIRGR